MTKVIRNIAEMKQYIAHCKRPIGFVPTMGNFHLGHESLFVKSVEQNQATIACIVLSPILFNNPDHFIDYPRTFEEDLLKAKKAGVDILFIPEDKSLFPDNYTYRIIETEFSKIMEGKNCSSHFDGVLAMILKLLLIVKPDSYYHGEKDYQQLELLKGMCEAFFIDVNIIACPTVRNNEGLAWSSRNSLLTKEQMVKAIEFPKALNSAFSTDAIAQLLQEVGFLVEYIEDYKDRRYGAVRLGSVRLMDNIELK
ncbi:MAG: pantoate--beta-alanine ligase [Alphaproteobacteria bacterium]|jgi:pantoate--beta-alanine ligase|nr:pantoate--beta-alanine ligase [Alphaproteobacteria bacterium]MBP9776342.1 pantoate--beta-alanine ligase [Alphaproteobacteria bacterium]